MNEELKNKLSEIAGRIDECATHCDDYQTRLINDLETLAEELREIQ